MEVPSLWGEGMSILAEGLGGESVQAWTWGGRGITQQGQAEDRREVRTAGKDGAPGAVKNWGGSTHVWKAEGEELVKRKKGWVAGKDGVMGARVKGVADARRMQTETQGSGCGDRREEASAEGEGKGRSRQG